MAAWLDVVQPTLLCSVWDAYLDFVRFGADLIGRDEPIIKTCLVEAYDYACANGVKLVDDRMDRVRM